MKKFICYSLVLVVIFAASASADVIGTLSRGNYSPENQDQPKMASVVEVEGYKNSLLASVFDEAFKAEGTMMKFYDSLILMQMALSKGEIDCITTPEVVGEFMLRTNSFYKLRGFMIGKNPIALAFGFLDDKKELRDRFSKAVEDMEREGVIGLLAMKFVVGPDSLAPNAVSFEKFDNAETIIVALTGDLPPFDYVAPYGTPTGFNTAILAEIGKRLHINIKPVIVETGSRAMALKSGRADVVFWFQVFTGYDKQPDVPEGIITSTPYYGWNKTFLIGRK